MNLYRYGTAVLALSGLLCLPAQAQQTPASNPTIASPSRGLTIHRAAPAHGDASLAKPAAPTELYSHGDPTPGEQLLLEMINRARANPAEDGHRLATTDDLITRLSYTAFGIDTAQIRAQFKTYPARPPLAFNPGLITAARLHSQDMKENNFQGHSGSNGSTFDQRILAQGYNNWTAAGENVAAYGQNFFHVHAGFNVDWGNPDLGHRHNVMNFAESDSLFTEIGIGLVIVENHQQPATGPMIVTEDFGNRNSPFLVGVVYNDLNGNGFYDVGEGLPGVTIMPSVGQYYAVTSSSGGYAILLRQVGTNFSVTASGGGLTTPRTVQVTRPNQIHNHKLDFVLNAALPEATILVAPTVGSLISADSARFSWRRSAAPGVRYRFQLATDPGMANIIYQDSTLGDTTTLYRALQNDTRYYWRVQAGNASGWGPYSEVRPLYMLMPPATVALQSPADKQVISPSDSRFTWKSSSAAVTHYWLEIASDNLMTQDVVNDSAMTDTTAVVALEPGATYWWRVRAKNEAGWSPFGQIWSVTVATSSVADHSGSSAATISSASPNPFDRSTTIRFTLPRTEMVTLRILDAQGRILSTLVDDRLATGSHDVTWNAEGAASGTYYYQLRTGASVEMGQILLVK